MADEKANQDRQQLKKERLAQALRENLKRRKAQSRQRVTSDKNENGEQ